MDVTKRADAACAMLVAVSMFIAGGDVDMTAVSAVNPPGALLA
jgi:hypothetical protein